MVNIIVIGVIACCVCVIGLIFFMYELNEIITDLEIEFFKFNKDLILLADVLKETHEYLECREIPSFSFTADKHDSW